LERIDLQAKTIAVRALELNQRIATCDGLLEAGHIFIVQHSAQVSPLSRKHFIEYLPTVNTLNLNGQTVSISTSRVSARRELLPICKIHVNEQSFVATFGACVIPLRITQSVLLHGSTFAIITEIFTLHGLSGRISSDLDKAFDQCFATVKQIKGLSGRYMQDSGFIVNQQNDVLLRQLSRLRRLEDTCSSAVALAFAVNGGSRQIIHTRRVLSEQPSVLLMIQF